uniref:Reverse transcriptase domain-containing protein n=1 Tax=Paramormyrops kingsleyae TaxID=1676925 RepID=A0A3B3S9M5_9TELE
MPSTSGQSFSPSLIRPFAKAGPRKDTGIRQGCPISPKLFILTTQLLALIIQNDPDLQGINIFEKEFKISKFADDTALFLRDKSMVVKALNTVSFFSRASGLCLNIKKCELLPIHTCSDFNIASIRVEPEVKYLGIVISKNMIRREDTNICSRIFDMKRSLGCWLTRDITIFGRVILSKAKGLSKLIFPCHSLYVSRSVPFDPDVCHAPSLSTCAFPIVPSCSLLCWLVFCI